ncbi:MAG: AsnC family transcriptional regulator [Candidatus Nanoarchaeia archaeon]
MNTYILDAKDKKILHELDADSRQSCSSIAKKIGLSTEVVNYRIKRLEHEQIITQYQLIVNLSQLNILQFKLCLSLQHIKSDKLLEIINKIKQMPSVKWIVSCKGAWDLLISLETDSIENMDLLNEEILILFEGFINKKSISILVEAQTYDRNYLIENKAIVNRSRVIMKKNKLVNLDELDMSILKKLSENARKPLIDIASELNITPRITNYRIKQLRKNNIILGFKLALNYTKLGIQFYKTFIYLDNSKKERLKSLIQYFEYNKNIIHHVKVIGNWDLEPEFEVYSEKEFDDAITKIKNEYSDIIKNIDIITISAEHKFVYF